MASDLVSPRDVVSFRWEVPGDGFRWVRGRPKLPDKPSASGWWLSAGNQLEKRYRGVRVTHPLTESPALFRAFAGLDPDDRGAVLAFANAHGRLGLGTYAEFDPPARGVHPAENVFMGEPVGLWAVAVAALRRAVGLWDLVQARDRAALARLVVRRASDAVPAVNEIVWDGAFTRVRSEEPSTFLGSGDELVWWYDTHPATPAGKAGPRDRFVEGIGAADELPPGEDPLPVAAALLRRWVSGRLDAELRLAEHEGTGEMALRLVPRTLYGAMWLQLARSVTGNKTYRQCKDCGAWFEMSATDDGRTARRVFCSDPCKTRDYRRRKDRALALKGRGKTPRQVAERLAAEGLETDPATVRKWVGGRRG